MTLREQIVATARAALRTRFQHQARLPGVALDCAGLLISTARILGLVAPDFDVKGYDRTPDGKSLLQHCDRWMTRIPRAQMAPGDAIVVRWVKDPQHIGIVGDYVHGGLSLIHALSNPDGEGEVVEHSLDESMLRRFVAAYKLPNVGD